MKSDRHNELAQKVAELIVVRASGHAFDSQRNYPHWELPNNKLKRLLEEGVGGVLLYGGSNIELGFRTRTLHQWAGKPLLICADVEEGLGQRFQGGTWLAPPMAIAQIHRKDPQKAIALAERYGACIGYQARRCGLNWILAPVCDVNNNSLNPVINVRAWGEDPLSVSLLASAFNTGLTSQGVLSCAKHFPGHGDTGLDSHIELPILDHDLCRLEEVELVPFRSVIASGVSSVMTAHLLIKEVDPNLPASISPVVTNQLLRQELGFDGLVVTDALVMESIRQIYGAGEAAVLAFAAGADLILMPENPDQAIQAISEALSSGRVPMDRLENSLLRRSRALATLEKASSDSAPSILDVNDQEFEREEDVTLALELVANSLEIRGPRVIHKRPWGINLLIVDSVLPSAILSINAPAICLPEEAGYKSVVSHQLGVNLWQEDQEEPLALERLGQGPILLQLFKRGNPFCKDSELPELWLLAIRQLQRKNLLAALVVYGSPYVWNDICQIIEQSIPHAYSPAQTFPAQQQVLSSFLNLSDWQQSSTGNVIQEFTD